MSFELPPEKLRRIGSLKFFRTREGHTVVVLPTCDVPCEHLIPENWGDETFKSGARRVSYYPRLANGASCELYVKEPEEHFFND